MTTNHPVNRKGSTGECRGTACLKQQMRRPDRVDRQQEEMHELDMFTEEQPAIEITAKPLSMQQIPQMFFVHRGITMRNQQIEIQPPIHRGKDDDVDSTGQPKPSSAKRLRIN